MQHAGLVEITIAVVSCIKLDEIFFLTGADPRAKMMAGAKRLDIFFGGVSLQILSLILAFQL